MASRLSFALYVQERQTLPHTHSHTTSTFLFFFACHGHWRCHPPPYAHTLVSSWQDSLIKAHRKDPSSPHFGLGLLSPQVTDTLENKASLGFIQRIALCFYYTYKKSQKSGDWCDWGVGVGGVFTEKVQELQNIS